MFAILEALFETLAGHHARSMHCHSRPTFWIAFSLSTSQLPEPHAYLLPTVYLAVFHCIFNACYQQEASNLKICAVVVDSDARTLSMPPTGSTVCVGHDGILDGECDCVFLRGLDSRAEVQFETRPDTEGTRACDACWYQGYLLYKICETECARALKGLARSPWRAHVTCVPCLR